MVVDLVGRGKHAVLGMFARIFPSILAGITGEFLGHLGKKPIINF